MIDLREKDREAICEIAEKVFTEGAEIWAYGSRVKGTNHDTSDLDLVVHFPPEQDKGDDYEQLSLFIETLRDSNIPIIVQALAWHSIPEQFRTTILSNYQVLWKYRG
ncbi:nucleotidyltransferase family protein [Endozoicomonas ascidiicola]|uniref:nucleotidyltransferase family protein n=1 Tax=Endozoicomonas ascidiicola TaxID=1698521 RepID=UPI00082BEF96|nr:nucleotidyltransferase domain-containing protein [Endozoicomonas ascidiicola]